MKETRSERKRERDREDSSLVIIELQSEALRLRLLHHIRGECEAKKTKRIQNSFHLCDQYQQREVNAN